MELEWWGYEHVNGSLHVKRYFGPQDLREARQSPMVARVRGPWDVNGREEALDRLQYELSIEG